MRAGIALLAATAGCFGAGPTPSKPSDATVLFAAPVPSTDQRCSSSVYIGAVAFGAQLGYAALLPYSPNNCGGQSASATQAPIMQFDKTGATPHGQMIGTATAQTQGSNALPRIVATATGALWAYNANNGSSITVDPGGLQTNPSNPGGFVAPTGLVTDGASVYVAGWSPPSGRAEVDNPQYPCCGPSNGSGGTYSFTRLPGPTQLAITPHFACETTHDCLVSTSSSLYYLEHEDGGANGIRVSSFPTAGTKPSDAAVIAPLDPASGLVPVGLAADEQRVAWALSIDYGAVVGASPGCQIWEYDVAAKHADRVLSTTRFSCMGLALDGDTAYFAIVGAAQQDDCNGCTVPIHGYGLGRVTAAGALEAIALGLTDLAAGPRRVYLDGDDLYAIDPLAIARIAKAALVGRQDFTP